MHSKGQGFASFDPRGVVGMGLQYATASSGANHSYGPTFSAEVFDLMDPLTHKSKGKLGRQNQNHYCMLDSLVMCSFSRYGLDDAFRQVGGKESLSLQGDRLREPLLTRIRQPNVISLRVSQVLEIQLPRVAGNVRVILKVVGISRFGNFKCFIEVKNCKDSISNAY